MCMYVYIMYVYTPTPCLSHFSALLSLQPCTPVLGAYNFSYVTQSVSFSFCFLPSPSFFESSIYPLMYILFLFVMNTKTKKQIWEERTYLASTST